MVNVGGRVHVPQDERLEPLVVVDELLVGHFHKVKLKSPCLVVLRLHLELVDLLAVRLELLVLVDGAEELVQVRHVAARELVRDHRRDVVRIDAVLGLRQLLAVLGVVVDVQGAGVVVEQHAQVLVAKDLLRVAKDLVRHLGLEGGVGVGYILFVADWKEDGGEMDLGFNIIIDGRCFCGVINLLSLNSTAWTPSATYAPKPFIIVGSWKGGKSAIVNKKAGR